MPTSRLVSPGRSASNILIDLGSGLIFIPSPALGVEVGGVGVALGVVGADVDEEAALLVLEQEAKDHVLALLGVGLNREDLLRLDERSPGPADPTPDGAQRAAARGRGRSLPTHTHEGG